MTPCPDCPDLRRQLAEAALRERALLEAARMPCGHACAECLKQERASARPLPVPNSDGWTRDKSGL